MNLSAYIDQILFFVSQWAGVTLPRIVAAVVGIAVCLGVGEAVWSRRMRPFPGLLAFLGGALLVGMALHTGVLHWLAATSYLTRIRMLMGLLSVGVMTVTFEAIRRSHLQERYALMWMITGLLVLICALFPGLLYFLTVLLNVPYVTAVVIVVFTFLMLVAFHFSLSLSGLQDDRSRLAQTCAMLEARVRALEARLDGAPPPPAVEPSAPEEAPPPAAAPRLPGTRVGAPLIISLAVVFVMLTGLLAPRPMIGEEVTHYYLLVKQAGELPAPTFLASVPTGWGVPEIRGYPHPTGWHYLGAVVYRLTGGSFAAVQAYHALFWLQLLWVGYLLARSRGGVESRSALLYVLVLATLPMGLIFSVAFYQDVPVAAQALTAFYLLSRRRFVASALFLGLAVVLKVTGVVFVPPYLALLGWNLWQARKEDPASWTRGRAVLTGLLCAVFLAGAMSATAWSLKRYAGAGYYPVEQVRALFQGRAGPPASAPDARAEELGRDIVRASHPGDLRRPGNFLIYGGALFWVVVALGAGSGLLRKRKDASAPPEPGGWLWAVGGFYVAVTAWQMRHAPDARFFLPGLVFLILPFAERAVRWPRPRTLLAALSALAIFQGGQVLVKSHELRSIPPGIEAAMRHLRQHPPEPGRVFMCPEDHSRLFPVPSEWYLGSRLREFWRASNDERLAMCREFRVGAIVIKKYRIRPAGSRPADLGGYPEEFARDLAADPRFEKTFENEAVLIYRLPPLPAEPPR